MDPRNDNGEKPTLWDWIIASLFWVGLLIALCRAVS